MLISHTPVRGVILKYFGENHTLCVKFEPNWTRCKQLEEGIKSLACGSWFYPFLSLFANSFNLERYSSRGGQEKPLGWRLGVFLDHHSMNILINTPRSNKILPRVLPKYSRLRLEYFGRTLGSILLLLGVFISNSTIVWFSLKYFRQNLIRKSLAFFSFSDFIRYFKYLMRLRLSWHFWLWSKQIFIVVKWKPINRNYRQNWIGKLSWESQ